eukprot:CFRG3028T1
MEDQRKVECLAREVGLSEEPQRFACPKYDNENYSFQPQSDPESFSNHFRLNLLLTSKLYGYYILANDKGFYYGKHETIIKGIDQDDDEERDALEFIEIKNVIHISLSCDELLLAVVSASDVFIYDVRDFSAKITLSGQGEISALQFNPVVKGLLLLVRDKSIAEVWNLDSTSGPAFTYEAEGVAASWSLDGEEIATGDNYGGIIISDAELNPKFSIPPLSFEDKRERLVVTITAVQRSCYAISLDTLEDDDDLTICGILDVNKLKFFFTDTYFMESEFRNNVIALPIPELNVVVMGQSNDERIMQWTRDCESDEWTPHEFDEEVRPQAPMSILDGADDDDTYTMGLAFDFSCATNEFYNDSDLPPPPYLMVYTTDCVLLCYKFLDLERTTPLPHMQAPRSFPPLKDNPLLTVSSSESTAIDNGIENSARTVRFSDVSTTFGSSSGSTFNASTASPFGGENSQFDTRSSSIGGSVGSHESPFGTKATATIGSGSLFTNKVSASSGGLFGGNLSAFGANVQSFSGSFDKSVPVKSNLTSTAGDPSFMFSSPPCGQSVTAVQLPVNTDTSSQLTGKPPSPKIMSSTIKNAEIFPQSSTQINNLTRERKSDSAQPPDMRIPNAAPPQPTLQPLPVPQPFVPSAEATPNFQAEPSSSIPKITATDLLKDLVHKFETEDIGKLTKFSQEVLEAKNVPESNLKTLRDRTTKLSERVEKMQNALSNLSRTSLEETVFEYREIVIELQAKMRAHILRRRRLMDPEYIQANKGMGLDSITIQERELLMTRFQDQVLRLRELDAKLSFLTNGHRQPQKPPLCESLFTTVLAHNTTVVRKERQLSHIEAEMKKLTSAVEVMSLHLPGREHNALEDSKPAAPRQSESAGRSVWELKNLRSVLAERQHNIQTTTPTPHRLASRKILEPENNVESSQTTQDGIQNVGCDDSISPTQDLPQMPTTLSYRPPMSSVSNMSTNAFREAQHPKSIPVSTQNAFTIKPSQSTARESLSQVAENLKNNEYANTADQSTHPSLPAIGKAQSIVSSTNVPAQAIDESFKKSTGASFTTNVTMPNVPVRQTPAFEFFSTNNKTPSSPVVSVSSTTAKPVAGFPISAMPNVPARQTPAFEFFNTSDKTPSSPVVSVSSTTAEPVAVEKVAPSLNVPKINFDEIDETSTSSPSISKKGSGIDAKPAFKIDNSTSGAGPFGVSSNKSSPFTSVIDGEKSDATKESIFGSEPRPASTNITPLSASDSITGKSDEKNTSEKSNPSTSNDDVNPFRTLQTGKNNQGSGIFSSFGQVNSESATSIDAKPAFKIDNSTYKASNQGSEIFSPFGKVNSDSATSANSIFGTAKAVPASSSLNTTAQPSVDSPTHLPTTPIKNVGEDKLGLGGLGDALSLGGTNKGNLFGASGSATLDGKPGGIGAFGTASAVSPLDEGSGGFGLGASLSGLSGTTEQSPFNTGSSLFGKPAEKSTSAKSEGTSAFSSTFGKSNNGTSTFGLSGTGGTAFNTSSNTATAFGASSSGTTTFDLGSGTSAFGANSSISAFGTPTTTKALGKSSFTGTTAFGGNATGGFGSSGGPSAFGSTGETPATTTNAFGSSGTNSFGSGANVFGSSGGTSAFGKAATTGSAFGSSGGAGAFGASAGASAFGTSGGASAFGTPGGGATAFGTTAFGTPGGGATAFGTPAGGATAFGNSKQGASTSSFGFSTPKGSSGGFGALASNPGGFGASTSAGGFGSSTPGGFGSSTSGGFGSSTSGGFGASSAPTPVSSFQSTKPSFMQARL